LFITTVKTLTDVAAPNTFRIKSFFLVDTKNRCNEYVPSTHFDMSHPMIVEIRRGCELLTADKTLMRFFTTVDALMRVQRARG